MTYAVMAGLTGMRAFVAAGSDLDQVVLVGSYYLVCAVGIGVIAVSLALERRHDED